MPASTPTLDRLAAESLRKVAGIRDEVPEADTPDEAADDVVALAWQAAELAVPRTLDTIVDAFVELARIVTTSHVHGGPHEVRTIMAAAAIQSARPHNNLDAFRESVTFFIVNTPGGALDAAFELVMGLTDADFEALS